MYKLQMQLPYRFSSRSLSYNKSDLLRIFAKMIPDADIHIPEKGELGAALVFVTMYGKNKEHAFRCRKIMDKTLRRLVRTQNSQKLCVRWEISKS